MTDKKLLIVAHCPSKNTQALADAIYQGSQIDDIQNVNTQLKSPFDCDANDALNSDAIILFTTENFGYMSGALKDFFDRIYYPCLDQPASNQGKPYALVVRAGNDGTGTITAIEKIITGLKWRQVHENRLLKGEFKPEFINQAQELGATISASLDNDLF